jgi:hypothetical protein
MLQPRCHHRYASGATACWLAACARRSALLAVVAPALWAHRPQRTAAPAARRRRDAASIEDDVRHTRRTATGVNGKSNGSRAGGSFRNEKSFSPGVQGLDWVAPQNGAAGVSRKGPASSTDADRFVRRSQSSPSRPRAMASRLCWGYAAQRLWVQMLSWKRPARELVFKTGAREALGA